MSAGVGVGQARANEAEWAGLQGFGMLRLSWWMWRGRCWLGALAMQTAEQSTVNGYRQPVAKPSPLTSR